MTTELTGLVAGTRSARRRRLPAWGFGAAALAIVVVAAIVGPFIIGNAAHQTNLRMRNDPPWLFGGTPSHVLGTDQLGRDVLGRVLLAARVSLFVSISVTTLALTIGTISGMIAGYRRGFIDHLTMRMVDVVASFPGLLLAVVVTFVVGGGILPLILVLSISRWPLYTRVARAEALRIRELPFVDAARALGYGNTRMLFENFLPNLAPAALTVSAVSLAQAMLGEAALSFLGLGVQPPGTSLGLMIAQGRTYVTSAWWLVMFPGATIAIITLSLASIVRSISADFDPRHADGGRSS